MRGAQSKDAGQVEQLLRPKQFPIVCLGESAQFGVWRDRDRMPLRLVFPEALEDLAPAGREQILLRDPLKRFGGLRLIPALDQPAQPLDDPALKPAPARQPEFVEQQIGYQRGVIQPGEVATAMCFRSMSTLDLFRRVVLRRL